MLGAVRGRTLIWCEEVADVAGDQKADGTMIEALSLGSKAVQPGPAPEH
jgi:hypothetical protein